MEEVEIGTVVCFAFAFKFLTSYGCSEFDCNEALQFMDFAYCIYKLFILI